MGLAADYMIGMDCGTTNIKAIILGADGRVVAEASRASTVYAPGSDMLEQDAEEWWEHAAEIFSEITTKARAEITSRIRGICVSSHTVTMLPLDKEGRPLRHAIPCQDNRSGAELREIVEKVGEKRFVNIVGGQPAVAFLPCKLLWFKKHEPELFEKAVCYLQASSYINYRLTGVKAMDIDQAWRTQCMDIKTMEWSAEIGAAIGVDLNAVLPKPELVNEMIGAVTKEAAAKCGIPAGTPVLNGCSDAMASIYAAGMSRLGEAAESSGTTSLVFVGSDRKSARTIPVVTRPCMIDGMPWVFDAPIQATGASLKWYIEHLAAEERAHCGASGKNIYAYLNELALEAGAGAGGLFYYPYLAGERAPLWNEYARGMFIGMRMDTGRAEFARSIFEGTSYALRHVIETVKKSGAKAELLRVCGGGAKSRTWSQIKASMLNMPVYVMDEESGDVPVGDALIVGHKLGIFPDLTEAVRDIVKIKEIIEPNPEWVKVYDELYPYYVSMYKHLDKDLRSLKETVAGM